MKKNYDLYINKCAIFNSLFELNSTDNIIKKAESILNNPIFIVDTSYRIIAKSKLAESENSSIEIENGECYLLSGIVDLMKKYKCIDTIYNSDNAFFHNENQGFIFCSIKINNVTAFYISVLRNNRQFKEEDLEIVNTLSKVLSIQLQKENIFISNSGFDEEYYLIDLLINKIDNLDHLKERLKYINFNLAENLLLLSIPFPQKSEDYRHNFGLKELVKNIKNLLGNCIFTYYKDMIIFLISGDDKNLLTDYTLSSLNQFLKLNNLRCGLSFVFDNLLDVHKFFYQTIYALKISEDMNKSTIINFFEDYIEYYLFFIAANSDEYKLDLSALIHPHIKKLLEFDKQNKTELTRTLKVYLHNNRNANETANNLNIHRSTFFYRYHKIQEILNIPLDKDNNLFKLELSFKILHYINKDKINEVLH